MASLSAAGRVTLAGAVALLLGGLVGGVGAIALAGSAALVLVALSWVFTVPLPRRMRRERLEFTWWIPHHGAAARHPDEAITVRVVLRNSTDTPLTLSTPRLSLSPGLRHPRTPGERVRIPPRTGATFDLEVRPGHAGRHVLHGAWISLAGPLGLAWVPLYFPNPLLLEVQPRGAGAYLTMPTRAMPVTTRAGRSTRRAGEGPELRELRDHRPGDPFRRIAWRASARKGKLLVRETEDESQTTRVLVVDASATMRGDDRGRARIDHAIELVSQAARLTLSANDRLGLVVFDRRVVVRIDPGDSPVHLRAIVTAMVESRALVDEDLTDLDEEGLVDTAVRYFREQEGVDVTRNAQPYEVRARLVRLVERAAEHDPWMRVPVRAKDPIGRALRAFCRARAIPLPLRHDALGVAKSQGLAAALAAAVEGGREARTVVVLSDFDAMGDLAPVRLAVGQLHQRRHRVSFVALAGEDFVPERDDDAPVSPRWGQRDVSEEGVRAAVVSIFTGEERVRLATVKQGLMSAGVPLHMASRKEPMAHWLRRASSPRGR